MLSRTLLSFVAISCFAQASAVEAQGLAAPLTGLLNRASYMNVYLTQTTIREPAFQPEKGDVARGIGFELAFGLPGGLSVQRRMPDEPIQGNSCLAKFSRNEVTEDKPCADVKVKSTKRRKLETATKYEYEEEVEIVPFSLEEKFIELDLGVSFSQTGAFISTKDGLDARVSIRELPAVTLYASFVDLPVLRSIHTSLYTGGRTGFLSMYNGRAYGDTTVKFNSETLQVGPVLGSMTTLWGFSVFGEMSYLWRDFKSVDWETSAKIPNRMPRRIDLSGYTFQFGIQFDFAKL
jgi:hypothetical protein